MAGLIKGVADRLGAGVRHCRRSCARPSHLYRRNRLVNRAVTPPAFMRQHVGCLRVMPGYADPDGITDSRLAIAASRGDDAAFATLYARYSPRIEGYLARLLGDRHLAEDVTHEVFVSALRRLRQD